MRLSIIFKVYFAFMLFRLADVFLWISSKIGDLASNIVDNYETELSGQD